MEVTIALLEKSMQEAIDTEGKKHFLVDGFPRKMDQAIKFEEVVIIVIKKKRGRERVKGFHYCHCKLFRTYGSIINWEHYTKVVESQFTLYFECSEETLVERLLKRGKSSGRIDDNIESIKKRFQTFKDTSFPVIEYYEEKGKVHKVKEHERVS